MDVRAYIVGSSTGNSGSVIVNSGNVSVSAAAGMQNVLAFNSGYVFSNASGGAVLGSGECRTAWIKNASLPIATISGTVLVIGANVTDMYPATVASGSWLSGIVAGFTLHSGESKEFPVDNLNKLRIMSAPASGQQAQVIAFK